MDHERTFHQITEQNDRGHKPSVLVYNRNKFYSATLTGEQDENGRQMAEFVNDKGETRQIPGADQAFTDEGQAMLANAFAESAQRSPEQWMRRDDVSNNLANTAIESTGIEKPKLKLRPEDITSAENRLAKLTNTNDKILHDLLKQVGDTPTAIRVQLDPNDGNIAVRNDVLAVLERHIDKLGEDMKLPERVQRNSSGDQKATDMRFNHAEKMSPREYAARLALAMLDGSFDDEKSKASRYDDLPANSPHNGQHRQSAELVLESLYGDKETTSDSVTKASLKDILRQNREHFDRIDIASRRAIQIVEAVTDGLQVQVIAPDELAPVSNDLLNTLNSIQTELAAVQMAIRSSAEDVSLTEEYSARIYRLNGGISTAEQSGFLQILNRLRHVGTLDAMEVDQLRIYAMRESDDIRQMLVQLQQFVVDSVQ